MLNSVMFFIFIVTIIISTAFAVEIKMKMNTLYLTASYNSVSSEKSYGAGPHSQILVMLEAYGINYEVVDLPTESLTLENNGVGLYNSIVIEGASQAMMEPIKSIIEQYQRKYSIRISYINCEPDTTIGFKNYERNVYRRTVSLTDQGVEFANKYQMNGKDMTFEIKNCIYGENNYCIVPYYHYDVQFEGDHITPLLKYQEVDYYAGAVVKYDGLQSLHFWIPFIDSNIAYFASHLWIMWSNYNMINGYRRLFLGIQVDDFFAESCFNSTDCSTDNNAPHYRTTVEDMENIAKWQKDISGRLPEGSDIKIELAINGLYILAKAQQGNTSFDTNWDDETLQKGDPLYKYFKDQKNQDNFYWLSGTFSHQNLDYATYNEVDTEMKLSIKMCSEPYLGIYDRPCFSQNSIISPEITGLHNPEVLKAFSENQVFNAVGDTTRKDLDPANIYFPLITNATTSNFEGFRIIPRHPTEIYPDCSTPEENMAEYYVRHPNDVNVNWEANLLVETGRRIKDFLKLRHDPYMFHEGNLRNADFEKVSIGGASGNLSMMQQWVESMVEEINKYYLNWPIRSIKMDDLVDTYIYRLQRQECKPEYTMIFDHQTNILQEIQVEASGNCKVPLAMIRKSEFVDVESEKIGNEPEIAWIELNGNPVSVQFTKEIKFVDEDYVGKTLFKSSSLSLSSLFSGYKLYLWIAGFALFVSFIIYLIFGRRKGYTYDYPSQSFSASLPSLPDIEDTSMDNDKDNRISNEYENQQKQLKQEEEEEIQEQRNSNYKSNVSNINMSEYEVLNFKI